LQLQRHHRRGVLAHHHKLVEHAERALDHLALDVVRFMARPSQAAALIAIEDCPDTSAIP
jgi:hypothetical protein